LWHIIQFIKTIVKNRYAFFSDNFKSSVSHSTVYCNLKTKASDGKSEQRTLQQKLRNVLDLKVHRTISGYLYYPLYLLEVGEKQQLQQRQVCPG